MNSDVSSSEAPRKFPHTRWSLVLAARQAWSPESAAALETLCRVYWFPLYAYVRRCGLSPHDAQDLTQEFFRRLLEKRWLDDVDRAKGRLRTFLLDRRGRVKVADFGLAKLVGVESLARPSSSAPRSTADAPDTLDSTGDKGQGDAGRPVLTDAGKVMGTPRYMAPEQVDNPADVDHRADIYALGVVFYQMLTGELPGKQIAPPSSKVRIDVRLDEVVLRALEKNPERRYEQVSELKTDVETIAGTAPGHQLSDSQRMKPLKAAILAAAIPATFSFTALYAIPTFQQIYADAGHALPTLTRLIFMLNPLGLIAIASILGIGAFLGHWRAGCRWMSRWTGLLVFFLGAILVVGLLAPFGVSPAEPHKQLPVAGDPPSIQMPDLAALEFRLIAETTEADIPVELLPDPAGSHYPPLRVERNVLLGTESIERARLRPSLSTEELELELQFTEEGRKSFADITRDNVGRQLAITMQGRVLQAPRIHSEILGGKAVIAGQLSEAERIELVWALNRSVSPQPALNVEHEFDLGFDQERKAWVDVATIMRRTNRFALSPMYHQLLVGQLALFDLDRGLALAWPAELPDWNLHRIQRWVDESGADLLAVLPSQIDDHPRFGVVATMLVPADDALWNAPPGRAALLQILFSTDHIPVASEPLLEIHREARLVTLGPTLPITYVFHTAGGAVGLLRVIGRTEHPTGFQLQYRLAD
jgi:hypothetical protein